MKMTMVNAGLKRLSRHESVFIGFMFSAGVWYTSVSSIDIIGKFDYDYVFIQPSLNRVIYSRLAR